MAVRKIPDILTEIVEAKKAEVDRLKVEVPVSELEQRIEGRKPPLNLAGALWGDSVRVIAEVKRASPTRGPLRPNLDPAELATSYADNGAAAVSVLTNTDHFQGSIEDLQAVHGSLNPRGVPVPRRGVWSAVAWHRWPYETKAPHLLAPGSPFVTRSRL